MRYLPILPGARRGAFVLGLPRNMDGSEGQQAADTRAFGDALAARTNLPLHYVDERLTSASAHLRAARAGRLSAARTRPSWTRSPRS